VLGAAHAALDEDPALLEAKQAYLEAYVEARSAQGHPARDATNVANRLLDYSHTSRTPDPVQHGRRASTVNQKGMCSQQLCSVRRLCPRI
jgi:hypothetical protein